MPRVSVPFSHTIGCPLKLLPVTVTLIGAPLWAGEPPDTEIPETNGADPGAAAGIGPTARPPDGWTTVSNLVTDTAGDSRMFCVSTTYRSFEPLCAM